MRTHKLGELRRSVMSRVRARLQITALEDRLGWIDDKIDAIDGDYRRDINEVWRLLDGHQERLARLERLQRIATVMAWIEQATLTREPLISVVIPTRERADLLARAIASVIAQSYRHWELVVCSDESDPAPTAAAVAAFDDARIVHVLGDGGSSGAARNRGLDRASGELIAYLDDDNRMHPNWLTSVAWAFEQRPEAEVLYGAIVIDDTARHHGHGGHEMPSAWLEDYDADAVLESNVADTSAIAHRAGLKRARWDETLRTMGDWDFLLRATAECDPLTLPAIACLYYTDASDRLSDENAQNRQDRATIQGAAAAERTHR